MSTGTLFVVSTPIGNLSDLTDRARRVLGDVDLVYAEDTRRTGKLLARIGADADLRSLHEHNEASRTEELVESLGAGRDCALVSDAGTPAVSDPGRRAVAASAGAGFRVVPVPGPSAVLAALAASGFPADRFTFLGFPPRSGEERREWVARCRDALETVVAFESPQRVGELLGDMVDAELGQRRCVLGRELTKMHEEFLRGTVAELASSVGEDELRGEVTLVLEAGSEPGWEEREDEVRRRARELDRAGGSTRDIAETLEEEYDVPRNEAYQIGLDAAEEG
ncbi:MAG: 16S rRNA (cytidine(1402)-2'-O)-methyltransferase [Candidatus Palauibacterales bacterium]|nr:16S rRNA (cytidine(1402)-2'-O)-methyltransferase [Candidatus Palauibacterales bacterium]